MNNKLKKALTITAIAVAGKLALKNINHYQTHYTEYGVEKVESWLQIDFFNWGYCFSNRITELN